MPDTELVERFSRSSGPGGQGVNTADSRVELRWDVAASAALTDVQRARLLDRLEKRELISRCRETEDRRTVRARIAPEGLRLLARLDEPVLAAHRKQLGHLGRQRLQALAGLLRISRSQVM